MMALFYIQQQHPLSGHARHVKYMYIVIQIYFAAKEYELEIQSSFLD